MPVSIISVQKMKFEHITLNKIILRGIKLIKKIRNFKRRTGEYGK